MHPARPLRATTILVKNVADPPCRRPSVTVSRRLVTVEAASPDQSPHRYLRLVTVFLSMAAARQVSQGAPRTPRPYPLLDQGRQTQYRLVAGIPIRSGQGSGTSAPSARRVLCTTVRSGMSTSFAELSRNRRWLAIRMLAFLVAWGFRSMFMNVSCPTCGHQWRVPERMWGHQLQCSACSHQFECGPTSAASAPPVSTPADKPPAVQGIPQSRPVHIEPNEKIHYRCPSCAQPLESPLNLAGQKVNCPHCAQRLQIPNSPSAPAIVGQPNTFAGGQLPPVENLSPPPAQIGPPGPVQRKLVLETPPVKPAAPGREFCLECGIDVANRPRVHTCPNCGSLLCSAICYREHSFHAHRSRH
jgi:DNA-directed RNA polymerase subunit RPC12/RpoP/ribosomal protein S27E